MIEIIIVILAIGIILWVIGKFKTTKSKTNPTNSQRDNKQKDEIVHRVKTLKKQKQHEKAIELLSNVVYEEEKIAKEKTIENNFTWNPPPWAYTQLAIIFRKERRLNDEIAILKRFLKQANINSNEAIKIEERLEKAKKLTDTEEVVVKSDSVSEYDPEKIKVQGIQILESLNIIATTKSIDTLIGRFEFLEKIYDYFILISSNKRYTSDIQIFIDEYKTRFYERIPTEKEINLLIKPDKNNLTTFYINCIYDCLVRFTKIQIREIENLKQESAKRRRYKKIIDTAEESKNEIIKVSNNKQDLDGSLEEINKIVSENRNLLGK